MRSLVTILLRAIPRKLSSFPALKALPALTALLFLTSAQLGLAEEPVVVVYSDPSLSRLEKEIGVTPSQKERFDDIVVKYRDPQTGNDTGSRSAADADGSASPAS